MTGSRLLGPFLVAALLAPAAVTADPWKDESGCEGVAERRSDWRGGYRDRDGFDSQDDDWRGHWGWRPGDRIPPFNPAWDRRAEIPADHQPPPARC